MHRFWFPALPCPERFSDGLRRAMRGACLALLVLAGHSGWSHAQQTDRARQKAQAETERSALQEKLQDLKRSISRTEAARSSAADLLAQTEAAISDARRSLRELAGEQQETVRRLDQLARQQRNIEKTIAAQRRQLANLMRRHYMGGSEDRARLLLSGDNPNRINRDLQYLGYLSQAQAALVESLQDNLESVERHRAEALNAKKELDEIAQEEREQKAALDREKERHAALVAQLSGKLEKQRREAGAIRRDEERLSGLVDRLQKLIEEQQREEALARRKREARQREQIAKRKAEQEKRRAQQAAEASRITRPERGRKDNPDAIDDDEPPSGDERVAGTASASGAAGLDGAPDGGSGAFAALRGRLKLPVQGELAARYGSRRDEGPPWKGLFIRAAEGSDVRAVASGRVIFADWLRGFGNLIIIDHGDQYMTIYGNNQAVLKRAGDRVGSGDVIASAGSSGGNDQSGLYFEMRYQGRAFDPLGWITLR